MLTLSTGQSARMCDGTTRRGFLQIGALAFGGLSLAEVLKAEEAAGVGSSNKGVINIHLNGGPSHQDIFDLKPEAPAEYRGEFSPIKTNVAGVDICEHLPKLAQMADKYALIRALVGSNAGHSNYQTLTGYNSKSLTNIGGRPSFGSVIAKLEGASDSGAPPYVAYTNAPHGYLGPVYKPFSPGRRDLLTLQRSMTAERLATRTSLLSQVDNLRREADASGQMEAMDSYTQRAYSMVTSGRVAEALDLKKEDPTVVERYGKNSSNLLAARRLIEAGVRTVSMTAPWGGWDTHGNNFKNLKSRNLPQMDEGLSALVWDLDRLGMLNDVSVVVWGEFGRTPRINDKAGRDHWPKVSMAFMAGGGIKAGQVVGATDRIAGVAKDRPVDYQEVMATLYHNMGVDVATTQIIDPSGRPQYLLDVRKPISELV